MRMRPWQDAKTIFKRMFYDAERDQSVVHCRSAEAGERCELMLMRWTATGRPITGRSESDRGHPEMSLRT